MVSPLLILIRSQKVSYLKKHVLVEIFKFCGFPTSLEWSGPSLETSAGSSSRQSGSRAVCRQTRQNLSRFRFAKNFKTILVTGQCYKARFGI